MMDDKLLNSLLMNETDVDGALSRLFGDGALYASLVGAFVQDDTMTQLETAIRNREWDDAFTAAHALKGLAGNLGFIPLFHETGELVLLIRGGRISEIGAALKKVEHCYDNLIAVISQNT